MKKAMYLLGVMMAIVLASVNVFFVVQDGKSDSQVIKDTQASNTRQDVKDCDIYKYERNATERWYESVWVDGKVEINGEIRYINNIGVSVEGKIKVRVPICETKDLNCCLKEFQNQSVQIL